MKKYLLALAACGLLAGCGGKKAESEQPVVEEEEVVAIVEGPADVRELLVVVPEQGNVMEEQYAGIIPTAEEGFGASWLLSIYYQQGGDGGLFGLSKKYLHMDEKNDSTEFIYGKREVIQGAPFDANAVVYKLIPASGGEPYYFWANEKGLTRLDNEMNRLNSPLNETLAPIL